MRNAPIIAAAILLSFVASLRAEEPRTNSAPVTFQSLDLWVDSGSDALAAYQVEITYDAKRVRIVGLEGGETDAFREAPYFDRTGFKGGRIIVAAFTTRDDAAPNGPLRVARIHLAVTGNDAPDVNISLMTAAKPGGERIAPKVTLAPTPRKERNESEKGE